MNKLRDRVCVLLFGFIISSIVIFSLNIYAVGVSKTIKVLFNAVTVKIDGETIVGDRLSYNGKVYVEAKSIAQLLDKTYVTDKAGNVEINKKASPIPKSPIPIEKLPAEYTAEMANINGDYVAISSKKFNENVMNDFLKKVSNKESAFVRTVNFTEEGDPIIIDYLYSNDKFIVTIDTTRDGYMGRPYRKITTEERKNLIVRIHNGVIFYLVTNLDKITDETYSKNMFNGFTLKSDPIIK